jgi:hypothetical protein
MSFPGLSSLTGGGGLTGGAAGPSQAGGTLQSGTGAKNINIGGNPNVTSGQSQWLMIGAVVLAGIWLWKRSK